MKKTIAILLTLIIVLSFAACGKTETYTRVPIIPQPAHPTSATKPAPSTSPASSSTGTTSAPTLESANTPPQKEEVSYEIGEANVLVYDTEHGSFWLQISVPVKNTGNTNLYLSNGTMDLEDETGHLVESISMVSVYPSVIMPGETAWYYEETTIDSKPETDLKVIPHVSVKKATVDCIRYIVSDLAISNGQYYGIKITGRVENTTNEDESMPYVVAFLYDTNDKFLGSAFTFVQDLKAGDKMGFSMSTFAPISAFEAENVGRYEVVAYPLQFQF